MTTAPSNKKDLPEYIGGCLMAVGCVLLLSIGVALGIKFDSEYWKDQAVKHGAAHYNQTTGKWQWNDATEHKP